MLHAMTPESKFRAQKGSAFVYVFLAVVLTGLLVFTLTNGPQKAASSAQIDDLANGIQSDLKAASAAVTECALNYSSPVDRNGDGKTCADATTGTCSGVSVIDNPNPTFPLYDSGATTSAYGGTGTALKNVTCPGAPGRPAIFNQANGQTFRVLDLFNTGTPTYSVNYLTDNTEGVLLRITRASSSALWTEAMSRLNGRYSTCQAAAVTAAGTCANGCFYYWIVRRSTSTTGVEGGCP
jgi:hypothetical protein